MSEWISVEDRLPPKNEGVIGWVLFNPDDPDISDYEFIYHVDSGVFQAHIKGVYQEMPDFWKVTHWQPLPEPPK